jgi:hypothetical protein
MLAATSGAPVGSLGAVTGLYHSHVRVTLRLYTRPVHVQQETSVRSRIPDLAPHFIVVLVATSMFPARLLAFDHTG